MFSIALMLMVCTTIFAQAKTFVVAELVNTDQVLLEEALKKCALDKYRSSESRTVMNFKSGTIVELLSFKELEAAGIEADASNPLPEKTELKNLFVLSPQGYVLEQIEPIPSLQNEKVRSEK